MNTEQAPAGGRSVAPLSYFKAGGFKQLVLETVDDLRRIPDVDEALWVAVSCPVDGLEFDAKTLIFLDTDSDKRIRPPEVIAAVDWIFRVLREPATLVNRSDTLRLDQINRSDPEGEAIHQAARHILRSVGSADAETIALSDTEDLVRIYNATGRNGDGIIPVSAAERAETREMLALMLQCMGGVTDLSGQPGVTTETAKAFYQGLSDYVVWWERGYEANGDLDGKVFVHGEATESAFRAMQAVRARVDDYFSRCQLAVFDPRAVPHIGFSEKTLATLEGLSHHERETALEALPLAHISGKLELPLDGPTVNPRHARSLNVFREGPVRLVLGTAAHVLSLSDWENIKRAFSAYETWLGAKPVRVPEHVGVERIRAMLADETTRNNITVLIDKDLARAKEMADIAKVEKLLRYHRYFFSFVRNYVSLPVFYAMEREAIFQAGTLVMEGSSLHLCVRVADRAKHAALAAMSGIYLVYCEISRADQPQRQTIAAALTAHQARRIMIGKNGVFYDRKGRDWDASVVQVIASPISLSEAAMAPFIGFARMVGDQFERFTSNRQKDLQASLDRGFSEADKQVSGGPAQLAGANNPGAAQNQPAPAAMNTTGLIAGGGIALAALSSSFAYIGSQFVKNPENILYTILVILVLIVLPSVLIAAFKLRNRDLGMVLEACGWAINARMRLSRRLALSLTELGLFPENALSVPHKPRRLPRQPGSNARLKWLLFGLFILALVYGLWF